MVDAETCYSQVEQTALALRIVTRKFCPYFQAYQVTILTNQSLRVTLHKPDLSDQIMKWAIELSKYNICYKSWLSLKEQVLADFIAKLPQRRVKFDADRKEQWWVLYVNRASRMSGVKIGLVLHFPTGEHVKQTVCLNFSTSNNEAEYKAIPMGLDLALTLTVTKVEVRSDF